MNEQDFIEGTLDWCNERRVERGMEPLRKLPQGRIGDPRSCPCGAATGLLVYQEGAEDPAKAYMGLETPEAVSLFVEHFDAGRLPQYEANS